MTQVTEPRTVSAQPNIQDLFLNHSRRERLSVRVHLVDGRHFDARYQELRSLRPHCRWSAGRTSWCSSTPSPRSPPSARSPMTSRRTTRRCPSLSERSSSSSTASGSASFRMHAPTATTAATTVGNIAKQVPLKVPVLRSLGLGQLVALGPGRVSSRDDSRPIFRGAYGRMGRGVRGQGLGHRTLGDDGYCSRPPLSPRSRLDFRLISSPSSSSGSRVARSATWSHPARRSSTVSAQSTCEQVSLPIQPVDATVSASVGRGRPIPERLPRPSIEPERDRIEVVLRVAGEIGPLRQILAQEAVGVFVGAALPRTLRVTEVDLDAGRDREGTMGREFQPPIPGQRGHQARR